MCSLTALLHTVSRHLYAQVHVLFVTVSYFFQSSNQYTHVLVTFVMLHLISSYHKTNESQCMLFRNFRLSQRRLTVSQDRLLFSGAGSAKC